jgi:hypothetical protein
MHLPAWENAQLNRTVELRTAELARIGSLIAAGLSGALPSPSTASSTFCSSSSYAPGRPATRRSSPAPGWARCVIRSCATPWHVSTPNRNTPGPRRPWPPRRASPERHRPGISGPPSDRRRARTWSSGAWTWRQCGSAIPMSRSSRYPVRSDTARRTLSAVPSDVPEAWPQARTVLNFASDRRQAITGNG